MNYLIGLALRRRPVTILLTFLLLAGGVFAYNNLQQELFPEIEFPNITITTIYPSANPEAVERDVTEPIEEAIAGMDGLKETRSTSYESFSLVLATFEFGEDMEEAKRAIEANLSGVRFPDDVEDPVVSRINNDVFPVLQLTVSSDRDIPTLQRLLDDIIVPQIERVPGVFDVLVIGEVDEQVQVTVDSEKLEDLGLSMAQVSSALRDNHASFPAGSIDTQGASFTVRTTHEFGSLAEVRDIVVGYERVSAGGGPSALQRDRPIRLSQVAEVGLGTAQSGSISRTNGKPSLVLAVVKDPDANTVAVTDGVLAVLGKDTGLPPDVEIATLSNDGPEVTRQLGSVQHDALIGLVLAIIVVFAFLLNLRPGLLRGAALTLRPTLIIGLTIPLSIFAGVLLLGPAGISLNFMSLAGLAVSIGNVVDNSIVVLENIYRHIHKNGDRLEAVFQGTAEVGSAIFASTMANIVVFLPLAFIQGLVGSFFTPFALTISFVLLASVLVPLTAVPALCAVFLRPGDFPDTDDPYASVERETLLQRWFIPVLRWCLGHKLATLSIALVSTIGSLGLIAVIPVTLFPSGVPQYLTVDLELPTGAGVGRTFDEVLKIEQALQGFRDQGMVDVYHVTLGSASNQFGPGAAGGGSHLASIFVLLTKDVPRDIADQLRAEMPITPGATVTVAEISNGPPTGDLEITVVGSNFTAVAATAKDLVASLKEVDGVINLSSDVSDARDEVVVNVDPGPAAEFGLTASLVGQQVGQFVVGRKVAEIDLEGRTLDLVVRGRPDTVDDIGQLQDLTVEGPLGRVKLGSISRIAVEKGPVSVSHFDGERSASITGNITAADTQAVGVAVQAKIDALELPPGVQVVTGGIFQQITEGFQDVFLAIGAGIVLIYLVMLITLGSLRMPLIILTSLPLALVGALGALAITGRSLSLSALMGFLLLVGIVVNNAIVLLTFVEQLEKEGLDVYEALLEAGRVRLRPILMTASVTLIALMPLALGSADEGVLIGAELATVIIGGLLSSTLLTLVVVPALYAGINVDLPRFFGGIWAALLGRRWPGRGVYHPLPGPANGNGN